MKESNSQSRDLVSGGDPHLVSEERDEGGETVCLSESCPTVSVLAAGDQALQSQPLDGGVLRGEQREEGAHPWER